jgi:hypothetical protein
VLRCDVRAWRAASFSRMGELKPGWVGRFFEDFVVGDVYRHAPAPPGGPGPDQN